MGKILRFITSNFEEFFSSVLLTIMVTISFANVISRSVVNFSIAFTEELTVYLFVWMTILGSSIVFNTGSNMVVNFFNEMFPKRIRLWIYILSTTISVIFFSVLAYMGAVEVADERMLGAMTESMHLPIWIFTVSIPIGSCLIIFRAISKAVRTIKDGTY